MVVAPGKLLLVLASTVILGSDSRGTYDHISLSHDVRSRVILSVLVSGSHVVFIPQSMFPQRYALGKLKAYPVVYIQRQPLMMMETETISETLATNSLLERLSVIHNSEVCEAVILVLLKVGHY
jgi:hypothetical protein